MPVQVWNSSPSLGAPQGTSVSVTFDHLSFVARGARLDGNDLRLYSVRGSVTTELHRVLDPASAWNTSNVRLWFKVDGPVSALASQEDTYFLVFEDKTSAPLQAPQAVFEVYDDFNTPTLSDEDWERKTISAAPGVVQDIQVVNGELALSAGPSGAGVVSRAGIRSRLPMTFPGLAMEASLRFEAHSNNDDCTLENLGGLWSHGQDRARAVWQRGGNVWHVLNDTSGGSVSRQFLISAPGHGDARRYMLKWSTPTVRAYADSVDQGEVTLSSTTFLTPENGSLNFGFDVQASGLVCSDRASKLWVDWVLVRPIFSDIDLTGTFLAAREQIKP